MVKKQVRVKAGRGTSFGKRLGFLALLSWVWLGLEQWDLKPKGRNLGQLGPLVEAAPASGTSVQPTTIPVFHFPPERFPFSIQTVVSCPIYTSIASQHPITYPPFSLSTATN